jgi:hypothetical protein
MRTSLRHLVKLEVHERQRLRIARMPADPTNPPTTPVVIKTIAITRECASSVDRRR